MRIILLFILSCIIIEVKAQQDPQLTMFWDNYSLINPAATGIFNKHFVSVCGRDQWVGFPGHPVTIYAVYDLKLNPIHGGIGINYTYDALGFQKNHIVNLNYAFHFEIMEKHTISLGISAGFINSSMDGTHWITSDGSTNGINDPS